MAADTNPDNQYTFSQLGNMSQDNKKIYLEKFLIDQIIAYKYLGSVICPILFRLVNSQTSTNLFLESLQQISVTTVPQNEALNGLQIKKAYLSSQRDQLVQSVLSHVKNTELQKCILEMNWLILK